MVDDLVKESHSGILGEDGGERVEKRLEKKAQCEGLSGRHRESGDRLLTSRHRQHMLWVFMETTSALHFIG